MLCFDRPHEPPEFARKTAKARTAVEQSIQRGERPVFTARWRDFKSHFSTTQHGKCGYCEHDTSVSYHGDVEHYAPKAEIHEIRAGAMMEGHSPDTNTPAYAVDCVCEQGYWWLAYEWSNYLFACAACNQTHKRCIFPVEPLQHPRRPDPSVVETALLLNPYEPGLEPGLHLEFDELGQVSAHAGSVRGWETIRTCRLDREPLRRARHPIARKSYQLVNKFLDAVGAEQDDDIRAALAELRELGEATAAFAGMVRIIFEHETEVSWNDAMTAWL